MKQRKIIAIISAVVVLMSIFASCASNTENNKDNTTESTTIATDSATKVQLVRDENGEIVTAENGVAATTIIVLDEDEAKATNTTTKQTTTKSNTTTKKTTTTTKKQSNNNIDFDVDIEFNEPTTKKTTTTTKKAETTQNIAKPLTASQKQWVLDNWFGQFPKYGAADGFKLVEMSSTNGLPEYINVNQGNYKSEYQIGGIINDTEYMKYLAKGCTMVRYYWEDTGTESVLYYKCVTN